MAAYIFQRLVMGAMTVLVVALITFFLIRALPGDALLAKLGESGHLSDEQLAEARHTMGLDRPVAEDLARWLFGLLRGDLGHSLLYEQKTVLDRIVESFPITFELALIGIVFTLLIGIPVGILSAVKQETPLDYVLRIVTVGFLAMPQFWVAILILLYLSNWFHYAPPFGYTSILDDQWKNLETFYIPGIILGTRLAASIMRITRSSVLETQREDYIRTARAKGLSGRVVIQRHVLRNALIPIVTLFGTQLSFLIAGSLIIEVIFGLQGFGWLTYTAILNRDYTQIQGNILMIATIIVGMNILVDISYGYFDPRIRQA